MNHTIIEFSVVVAAYLHQAVPYVNRLGRANDIVNKIIDWLFLRIQYIDNICLRETSDKMRLEK